MKRVKQDPFNNLRNDEEMHDNAQAMDEQVGQHREEYEVERMYIHQHSTHWACDLIIDRYGDKSYGCCCTGHNCRKYENRNKKEKAAEGNTQVA